MTGPVPTATTGASASIETAPAVVAVIVTCNPGSWFKETLEAFRNQDYPNLSVLIIDAASAEDPLERIVETLPTAYVRRLSRNPGYAAASNRVLRILQGATYLAMCHDDVAPAPDAIRRMVEEAIRTNAGIVTPKMVEWLRPDRLTALGGSADITGAFVPAVESGDLDQGQYDVPGDVFVAPSGCTLVRADLFTSLGGFDPAMTLQGEDVDFSWRAHVVGARVVTAAAARVRHLAASGNGWRMTAVSAESEEDDAGSRKVFDDLILARRHRLRTVLKVQRRGRLLITLLQLIGLSIGEILYGLFSGKSHHAGAVVAAWTWNLAHWRDVRKLRKQLQRFRTVDDKVIQAKLVGTRSRVEELVAAALEKRRERKDAERLERRGRDFAGRVRHLPVAVWASVLVIWTAGSRHILTGTFPIVGQFTPFLSSPLRSLKQFSGMVPTQAWGVAALESPVYLAYAALSTIFFGAVGTLHRVLILGMFPLGIWGVARLVRRLKSPRARLMAVAAYVAVPLPYDSLSTGHWDGLVAYATAPFLLHRLLIASGTTPWIDRTRIQFLRRRSALLDDDDLEMLVLSEDLLDETDTAPEASNRMRAAAALLAEREVAVAAAAIETAITERASWRDRIVYSILRRMVPLALLMALSALVAPQFLFGTVVLTAALGLGSLFTKFAWREAFRMIGVVTGAGLIALVLVLPAILGSDTGWRGLWQMTLPASTPSGFGALLRFSVGGAAPVWATFGLLITALPGVVVGTGWRLTLSLRLWLASLVLIAATWAGVHSWLGPLHPDPHVFLALAGATLALNAAVGVVALQQDMRVHSFGWRHALPVLALLGVIISIAPIASRAGSGTWELPDTSSAQLLSLMNAPKAPGSYRVLWLGGADAMPGGARRLAPDLAAAISVDSFTPKGPGFPSTGGKGQKLLARDITLAREGNTVQLGRLLAPFSVRYIVVPNRTGAIGSSGTSVPPPDGLVDALASQLDLSEVETDTSLSVFQNISSAPVRSALTQPEVDAAHNASAAALQATDLSQAPAVLPVGHGRTWTGNLAQQDVFVSENGNSAWRLKVGGHEMKREAGFGWASTFAVGRAGHGELHFVPSLWIPAVQIIDALLWFVAIVLAARYRPHRGRWA
jgi:GT2 family glycosyltransferase